MMGRDAIAGQSISWPQCGLVPVPGAWPSAPVAKASVADADNAVLYASVFAFRATSSWVSEVFTSVIEPTPLRYAAKVASNVDCAAACNASETLRRSGRAGSSKNR